MKRLPVNLPLTYYLLPVTCGCYNGFYFDAAYGLVQTALSHQGTSVLPNDNMWSNVPGGYFGIDAGNTFQLPSPISWYYRNVGGQYNPSIAAVPANYIFKYSAGNPAQSSCTSCGGLLLSGMMNEEELAVNEESELESILEQTNDYGEMDESFGYFEKQYVYSTLSTSTISNNLLTNELMSLISSSSIEDFADVYRLFDANRPDSAEIMNNRIVPVNQIEVNRQWVNDVCIQYILPQKSIPQNIIDELINLASSSPFVEGDAVYTARAIVNYQEEEPLSPKSMETISDSVSVESANITLRVHPNPAADYLMVETNGIDAGYIRFTISNAIGVNLMVVLLDSSFGTNRLDVSRLKPGLYLYNALHEDSDESCGKGRLIINR